MKAPNIKRCLSTALCGLLVLTAGVSSAIVSFAEDTDVTAEKTLVDFSACETGKTFELPERMEFISGNEGSNYEGTKTIALSDSGKKYLNIAIDKKVKKQNSDTVQKRDSKIAFKVTVPSNYLKYLSEIKLKYSNDVVQKDKFTSMYAIIGVTDGTNYGKTDKKALSFASGNNKTLSAKMSDMIKTNITGFLGSVSKTTAWESADTEKLTNILVYITMPYSANGKESWNIGIESLSVVLKGSAEEIKNVDKIEPLIENFDSSDKLDDLKKKGTFYPGGVNFSLTDKANSETNALLFKSKGAGTDYDTYLSIYTDKRVADVKGITFKVRNLDTTSAETLRCFISTKNAKGESKTYQHLATIAADDGKYRTVRIYFDSVGIMQGDKFWGGSTAYAMTADEIRNISNIEIRIPYMGTHEGVAFDDINYMVEDDRILRTKTIVDFDNCKPGDDLPDGITKSSSYGGTTEFVTDAEGKTSYRINFNKKESAAASKDKINERAYMSFAIPIPAGMLYDCAEIRLNVTKKGNTESTIPYLMSINDGEGLYGKADQSSQHITKGEGSGTYVTSLNGLIKTSSGWNLLNWVNPNGAEKWTNDDLKTVKNIVLYIAAPTCDGTEGVTLDIHSIELFYTELPEYTETATRTVFVGGDPENTASDKISANTVELNATDKNYRRFSEKVQIVTNDKGNTEYVSFVNRRINFMRDLTPFTETATLFMYVRSDYDTTLKMNLVTKNGDRLPFEVSLTASDANDFEDLQIPMKDIIEDFYAENPEADFTLEEIYALEMLPVSENAGKVELSCLTLWSREVGEVGGSNSYYYYENGVAVEAYNDYLNKEDVVTIEAAEADDMLESWGITVPKGYTPLLYRNVILSNRNGDTIEPADNIWLTFDLPDGSDLNNVSIYRIYFDGSLLPVRHVIETDKLSIHTFQVGAFMLFTKNPDGTPAEDSDKEDVKDDTTSEDITDNTDDSYYEEDYDYDYDDSYDVGNINSSFSENNDEEQQVTQIVRRKKFRKKKKTADSGMGLLEWSLIGAGALVVLGGGATATVLIVKKKKKGAAK